MKVFLGACLFTSLLTGCFETKETTVTVKADSSGKDANSQLATAQKDAETNSDPSSSSEPGGESKGVSDSSSTALPINERRIVVECTRNSNQQGLHVAPEKACEVGLEGHLVVLAWSTCKTDAKGSASCEPSGINANNGERFWDSSLFRELQSQASLIAPGFSGDGLIFATTNGMTSSSGPFISPLPVPASLSQFAGVFVDYRNDLSRKFTQNGQSGWNDGCGIYDGKIKCADPRTLQALPFKTNVNNYQLLSSNQFGVCAATENHLSCKGNEFDHGRSLVADLEVDIPEGIAQISQGLIDDDARTLCIVTKTSSEIMCWEGDQNVYKGRFKAAGVRAAGITANGICYAGDDMVKHCLTGAVKYYLSDTDTVFNQFTGGNELTKN